MSDSTIRLRQLNQVELSGFVAGLVIGYLSNQNTSLAATGNLTGSFYPLSQNPSGYQVSGSFVSAQDLNNAIAQALSFVSLNYYGANNPSGYLTSSGAVLTSGNQTISGTKTFSSGISVSNYINFSNLFSLYSGNGYPSFYLLNSTNNSNLSFGYDFVGYPYFVSKDNLSPSLRKSLSFSANPLLLNPNGLVGNDGNVGIWNNSPQYTLDVNGTIGNSSGNLNLISQTGSININSQSDANITSSSGSLNLSASATQAVSNSVCNVSVNTFNGYTTWNSDIYLNSLGFDNFNPNSHCGRIFSNSYYDSSFSSVTGNIILSGQKILSNSKVGILNNNPNYSLDVSGYGNFSSGVLQNGLPIFTKNKIAKYSSTTKSFSKTTPCAYGINVYLTPKYTGTLKFSASVNVQGYPSTSSSFAYSQCYYGTGLAPSGGSGFAAGSAVFGPRRYAANNSSYYSPSTPMSWVAEITGLNTGTQYWFDIGTTSPGSFSVGVDGLQIYVEETY